MTPDFLKTMRVELARIPATESQLARQIGIAPNTLSTWTKNPPKGAEARITDGLAALQRKAAQS